MVQSGISVETDSNIWKLEYEFGENQERQSRKTLKNYLRKELMPI